MVIRLNNGYPIFLIKNRITYKIFYVYVDLLKNFCIFIVEQLNTTLHIRVTNKFY